MILRTKRNVLAADRRERRLSFFEMCVYFEDTGTRCRLRKKNRKENITAERFLAEPKAYTTRLRPPAPKSSTTSKRCQTRSPDHGGTYATTLQSRRPPGRRQNRSRRTSGTLGPASPMRRPLPTSPRSNAFSRGRARTVGAPPHEHHQV